MPNQPKKLLMLGVDAALPDLIRRFTDEGVMPNTKALMERGVFSRMVTTFPTLTASAWTAIVSGAATGSSGIPSLMVKLPGQELDQWHTSFDRRINEAETLWDVGSRTDRKTLLVNWPVTFPLGGLDPEKGLQIAASLNPPFRYFYMPLFDVASSSIFSTQPHRCNQIPGRAVQVTLQPAQGWQQVPAHHGTPLEVQIEVPPTYAKGRGYHVLVLDTGGNGYDRVLVSPSKNAADAVADLGRGERSPWITEDFVSHEGKNTRGRFYFQLIRLEGAEDFRLYQSAINTAEELTTPSQYTAELVEAAGPYMEVDDPWAYMDGWVELDWYLDNLTQHNDWWERATRWGMSKVDWDLCFTWVGTIDHVQHVLYGGIDPKCIYYDPHEAPKILDHIRRVYREVDERIGRILSDVDLDETLVCLVSDHGFSALEQNPYLKKFLADAGLLSYRLEPQSGEMIVDWSRTKAFPLEPCHAHIFVNLKGRDPQGIVEPEDYAKVQDEIIDCLYGMKDPNNGQPVVAAAVRKEEAGTLGVYEGKGWDRIGDVLFALRPQYLANPFIYQAGVKYQDGTERVIPNPENFEPATLHQNFSGAHVGLPSTHEMHATMILAGGNVRHVDRRFPMSVVDLAPTLSYLLGLPVPRDAEGNVLQDVPENLVSH